MRPRPTIKPWLARLWRDPQTLQIGVEPGNGVLVSGVDRTTAIWLASLDGSRSEAEALSDAALMGLEIGSAVGILAGLSRAGVLINAPMGLEPDADPGSALPELVGLNGPANSGSDGSRILAERRQRHVVINGANRIGVPLGAMLAASAVGGLTFLDPATVRRCDASVGGLDLADEGQPRTLAAQRAVRRTSSTACLLPDPAAEAPDLVVLCQPWAAHDPLHGQAVGGGRAHMAVAVRDGTAVIGPLVVPGRTSCLRCAELHRTDRDPRWPAVAAQLTGAPSLAIHEPSTVLAALAAAVAAAQVLDFLDGSRVPDVVEATLELRPPDWQIGRRPWPPHVDCGCAHTLGDPVTATG